MPVIFNNGISYSLITSGRSWSGGQSVASLERQAGDVIFTADLILTNAIVGSRYLLLDDSDHSTVLSDGLITASPMTIPNVPAFNASPLMLLRIRNGTGSPFYRSFETKIVHSISGSASFISQELDE